MPPPTSTSSSTSVAGVPLRGSDGENQSGMLGGYLVFGKGQNYGLASLTGFWGSTDVTNDDLELDRQLRHQRLRRHPDRRPPDPPERALHLDLRGSVGYLSFTGDAFTDSQGFQYGELEVSFGYVKFQPGINATIPVGDQMIRPYLRAEFAERINYQNSSSFQGETFPFEDNDFSAAAMIGTDYALKDNLTLSGEVAGYTSGDFNAVTAKIGLKFESIASWLTRRPPRGNPRKPRGKT